MLLRPTFLALAVALLPTAGLAQPSEEDRIRQIAERLDQVLGALEERNAAHSDFVAQLQQGLVNIEQADERVQELIDQLTQATDNMQDGSEIDTAIDDYKGVLTGLIAEAEASNNDAIKAAIPELREDLATLEAQDGTRAGTVIEARNLIRALEQDREAIAFFIRANQAQRAAALISANIDEFVQIVADGKELAASLMGTINP